MRAANPFVILAFLSFCNLPACPPSPGPQPPPPPDAADATSPTVDAADPSSLESQACAAMVRLGCVVLPTCASTIKHINSMPAQFDRIDVSCVIAATSYTMLPSCGVASCQVSDR